MIRIIRWLLTLSIRYSYLFGRAILRLPLLLLPIPPRVRNQIAGSLAVTLWFACWFVLVALSDSSGWGPLMVAGVAALVIMWVIGMEGRRPVIHRPTRVR